MGFMEFLPASKHTHSQKIFQMTKKTPYDFAAKEYGFLFECTNDPSISVYYVNGSREITNGHMVQVGNEKVGFKIDLQGGRSSTKYGEQHIWEFDDLCQEFSTVFPHPHRLTNKHQFDSAEEQELFINILIDAFSCEEKNGLPVKVLFSDNFVKKVESGEYLQRAT